MQEISWKSNYMDCKVVSDFWGGESLAFFVQTTIFLLTAIAGFWALYSNSKMSRLRATIDLNMQERHNLEFNKHRIVLSDLTKSPDKLVDYAAADLDEASREQARSILEVLNNYEFAAVGIKQKAFCEKTYKDMKESLVIRDWSLLSSFVVRARQNKGQPTFCEHFEALAKKWVKEKSKKK